MSEPLGIALLGCGTVGTGVVQLLAERFEYLLRRSVRGLALRHVVVRDPEKWRPLDVNKSKFISDLTTTDWTTIIATAASADQA